MIGRRAQGHKARRWEGVTRTRPEDRVVRATNQAGPGQSRATSSRHRPRMRGTDLARPAGLVRDCWAGRPLPRHWPAVAIFVRNGCRTAPGTRRPARTSDSRSRLAAASPACPGEYIRVQPGCRPELGLNDLNAPGFAERIDCCAAPRQRGNAAGDPAARWGRRRSGQVVRRYLVARARSAAISRARDGSSAPTSTAKSRYASRPEPARGLAVGGHRGRRGGAPGGWARRGSVLHLGHD